MKHYTSISQSKKLLELGLNPETADMYYMETSYNNYTIGILQRMERDMLLNQVEYYKMFPCWSLGALLELMPHIIEDDNYTNEITPLLYPMQGKWFCVYNELDKDGYSPYAEEKGTTPIEATYSMVVWLLENGFIKKS